MIARLRRMVTDVPRRQIPSLFAVGLVLGVFPIAGVPTVLCLLAAFLLRLNIPALQALNSITWPLQVALLLPLARAGYWLCGEAAAGTGPWTARLASGMIHAIAGWACICIPIGALVYLLLDWTLRGFIPASDTRS